MIGDVFCNDNREKIQNQRVRLTRAKERIANFSTLNSIFNNFEDYEALLDRCKDLPKNVVFTLISSDNFDNHYTQSNLLQSAGTVNSIRYLQDAINQFFISNPDMKKEYEEFCIRLKDYDNFTSAQPYHEITTAYEIGNKIGFDNVKLFSSSGLKKPDLLLNLDGKSIYLELTALEIRTPEKKITEIASAIANYILKKTTKKDYFISIVFDTLIVSRFKDDRGYILEKDVIAYLKEMIDRLHLNVLIGINGSVNFHDGQIYLNGKRMPLFPPPIEAIIHIEKEYGENKSVMQSMHLEIIDCSKTEKDLKDYKLVQSWAHTIPLNDFLNSPFDTVGYSTGGGNECIYINSLDFDSTDENLKNSYLVSTSQIAKKSFISHIKRRINDKIDSSQFKVGTPLVIGIQASQWQYEYEWDYDDFVPLRNEIQEHLKKYPQISGIILFTYDLFHGRLIENPIAHCKITKDIFERSGILIKHYEPLFTHDKKVDLSTLDYNQKSLRILDLISQEPLIIQDGDNSFANEDLGELLQNIGDFLGEKNVKQEVLLAVEPIIIKYCIYRSGKEDDPVRRNESISNAGMFLTGVPLRAYAAQALLWFERHCPSSKYSSLIEQLASDENTYVRMFVAEHLGSYFDGNQEKCMSLGRKFCLDNKYVRGFLRYFLTFLAQYHRIECLDLICFIIKTYGKEDLKAEGEDLVLEHIVNITTQLWIMIKDNKYQSLFEELISGTYNFSVKKELVTTMAKATANDPTTSGKTINYFLQLLRTSPELKPEIEFHLLYQLIQKGTSLLPIISPLLEELSIIQFGNQILNIGDNYHFIILDYIHKFFDEFQESATVYFLRVVKLNELLTRSFKVSTIIKVLEKIFDSNVDLSLKKEAKVVLEKIDQNIYWQARNLSEKVKDL